MYMLPLFQMLNVCHMWRDSTRHCMVDIFSHLSCSLLQVPSRALVRSSSSSQTIGNVIRGTQLSSSVSAHQQPAFRQHKQTGHLHTSPALGLVWRGSKVDWECLSLSIVYHIHSVVSPLLSILSSNSLSPYNIYFDRLSRGNHPWDSVESRRDFQKFENTKWKVLCIVTEEKEWNHIEVGHFNIKSLW